METNNSREITLTGMENNNFIIELFSQEIAWTLGKKKPQFDEARVYSWLTVQLMANRHK